MQINKQPIGLTKKCNVSLIRYFEQPLHQKRKLGFTIVELLVVIVVIGILAAISVVAYNGIQNRANDTAVKNDLTNMAKKIQLNAADTGEFIKGGNASGDSTLLPGFTFAPTKSAYTTDYNMNLIYCEGSHPSGHKVFRIQARSKSNRTFSYDSSEGLKDLGLMSISNSTCSGDLTNTSYSYGYNRNLSKWFTWTNG